MERSVLEAKLGKEEKNEKRAFYFWRTRYFLEDFIDRISNLGVDVGEGGGEGE